MMFHAGALIGLTEAGLLKNLKRGTDLFKKISGLETRSLASKHLHFHRPDLFFIYDSRAKKRLAEISVKKRKEQRIKVGRADKEYLRLVERCQLIRESSKADLTPREVDRILLRRADRRKCPPCPSPT